MSSIRPVASATFNKPRYWTHDQRLFAIAKLFKVQPQLGLTRSGNGRTRVLFLLLLLLPWGSAFKVMLCSVFNLVTFPIYTAAPRCLAEVNPALAGPAVLFSPRHRRRRSAGRHSIQMNPHLASTWQWQRAPSQFSPGLRSSREEHRGVCEWVSELNLVTHNWFFLQVLATRPPSTVRRPTDRHSHFWSSTARLS